MDMQFSRILYNLLIKHALASFCMAFLLINMLMVGLVKSSLKTQVHAQQEYVSQLLVIAIPSEIVKPLSDNILGWSLISKDGDEVERYRFGKSWQMAESQFTLDQGSLIIVHKTVFSAYIMDLALANFVLLLAYIGIAAFTHFNFYRHWRVLIQLEAWASRYSKNRKFKFMIGSRDYLLVNSIRGLLKERSDAQKGGHKADHFIRSQTFLDNSTGLGNRLYFEHRLDSVLQQDDKVYGAVLIIYYGAVQAVREEEGKDVATVLLQEFAEILKEYVDDTAQSVVSRINDDEFAILLPYVDGREVERIALNVLRMSQKVRLPDYVDTNLICHIGADMYDRENTSFQIMAEADMALRAAQLHGPSGWFMYDSGELPPSEIKGSVRWRTTIQNALDDNKFVLYFQPVIDNVMRVHHHEVLARMEDGRGELISAKVFFPMAKKCGLIPEIDKQVLTAIAETLEKNPFTPISVNIHIDSWLNREFCNWLIRFLKQYSQYASFLIFEISEFELSRHSRKLRSILSAVKRYHVQLMVDQVGLYVIETSYLQQNTVEYLKLHRSIVNNLHEKPENQMFIRSLQSVVTEKELLVFAMGVESEQELNSLNRLGVTGVQGHYIKRPAETLLAATDVVDIDGDNLDL